MAKSKVVGLAAVLLLGGLLVVYATYYRDSSGEAQDSLVAIDASEKVIDSEIAFDAGEDLMVDAAVSPDALPDSKKTVRRGQGHKNKPNSKRITEANRMLKEGRYVRARPLVKNHLLSEDPGDGFVITVKSFCGKGKQGTAQDWLLRIPRGKRKSVISYCRKNLQVELVNR